MVFLVPFYNPFQHKRSDCYNNPRHVIAMTFHTLALRGHYEMLIINQNTFAVTFLIFYAGYVESRKTLLFTLSKSELKEVSNRYTAKAPNPLSAQFADRLDKETAVKNYEARNQKKNSTPLFPPSMCMYYIVPRSGACMSMGCHYKKMMQHSPGPDTNMQNLPCSHYPYSLSTVLFFVFRNCSLEPYCVTSIFIFFPGTGSKGFCSRATQIPFRQ